MFKHTVQAPWLAIAFAIAGSANAMHIEVGDAGDFPAGSAQATGSGPLDMILGNTAGSDFVDAYLIEIVDPAGFSAFATGFDTRLWLFETDGTPLLANDNGGAGEPENSACLSDPSNYGATCMNGGTSFPLS